MYNKISKIKMQKSKLHIKIKNVLKICILHYRFDI